MRGGGTGTTPYHHCAAQMAVGQRRPLTESLTEDTNLDRASVLRGYMSKPFVVATRHRLVESIMSPLLAD